MRTDHSARRNKIIAEEAIDELRERLKSNTADTVFVNYAMKRVRTARANGYHGKIELEASERKYLSERYGWTV